MQHFLLTLVVLCVSGQLLHYANGQCALNPVIPTKRVFQDDADLTIPEVYDVEPDVIGVELDPQYKWFKMVLNESTRQLQLFPTEEIRNYFADPRPETGTNLNLKETKLLCSNGGPVTINNIPLGIDDTNNMSPEFFTNKTNYEISLPYHGAPINWDSYIMVTDKDYDFENTRMDFSIEPAEVVVLLPGYPPERVPPNTAEPLEYYKVYFGLNDAKKENWTGVITLTATDAENNEVPYSEIELTLTTSEDVDPPQIIEDPVYFDKPFPNVIGQPIQVATVRDSGLLTPTLEGDNAALFTPKIEPSGIENEWSITVELNDIIPLSTLEVNNYVIRLTLNVKDDAAIPHSTQFPLVFQFKEERLSFDSSYYDWHLEVGYTDTPVPLFNVTLDPPVTDVVEYSIDPISGSTEYLEIDPVTGEITSTRTEEDLVNNNQKVDVFLVRAKKTAGTESVTVTVIIYNKPDPSLITTTTTTEETTTNCPTEATTVCSCNTPEPEPCTTQEPEPCTTPEPQPCTTLEPEPCICSTTTTEETTTNCPTEATTVCSCNTPEPEPCTTQEPEACNCPTSTTPSEISSTASSSPCSPCPPTEPPGSSTDCPPTTTCPDKPTPCPVDCTECPNTCQTTEKPSDCSNTGLIIGIAVVAAIAVVSTAVAAYFIYKMVTSAKDPLKGLTHVENANGYEKFKNDPERGPRDSIPGDSSMGGHANRMGSIGNDTSLGKSFDTNGGGSLNQNFVSDTSVTPTSKNLYTDPIYSNPTYDVASKSEKSKEPKTYSESKRNKADSVDGSSIYARPISESYASTAEPSTSTKNVVEPKVAEPLIEEPKIDYKVVEFGGVELIPSDVEEEVEAEEEVERL